VAAYVYVPDWLPYSRGQGFVRVNLACFREFIRFVNLVTHLSASQL